MSTKGRTFVFGNLKFTSPPKMQPTSPLKDQIQHEDTSRSSSDPCSFCNRKVQHVLCRACGHLFAGRARVRCPNHGEVIHLMDYEVCPNCLSSSLKEFAEVTPQPRSSRQAMLPQGPSPRVDAIPTDNIRQDY